MENRGPKTTSSRSKDFQGFTLVEILIVLAIVSFIMSMGMPAIQRVTYQRVNSTTRKFVGLLRTIRNDAILLNRIHRLAVNLDDQTWWVESQREFRLLGTGDAEATHAKEKAKPEASHASSDFSLSEKHSPKPLSLPKGVRFNGVLKEREGVRKEGVVYVHFFPNGYNDAAVLYLSRDGSKEGGYSLVLRSASGRLEVLRGLIRENELENP